MQRYAHFSLFLSLLLLTACHSPEKPAASSSPAPQTPKELPELFTKILDAHGGLSQWEAMNTLEFVKGEGDEAEYHTVDLKSRQSLIEQKGKFRLGSNGEKVWVTPHRDSFPGRSPRFYHNLYFYFVAIPYVLADPGVVYEDLGEQLVGTEKYRVLKTGFQDDVGDAPDDQYWLYVDPETYVVDFITYSVTYFDASKATSYNALKYDWSPNNGLLVPKTCTGYKWEDGALGEQRYVRDFTNVNYSKEKTDPQMFAVPEGAFVE